MSSSDDMMYDSDDEDSNYSDDDDLSYDDITIKSLLDKNYYTVLKETDIQQRQEEDIYEISSVLQVPNESACLLLRHYNWKVDEVKDQWFANEEKVRKEVGIIHKKLNHNVGVEGVICGICFESSDSFLCVGCGHMYCKGCWIGYLQTAINDGPGCLTLRCPEPSCCAAVGQDLVDRLGLAKEDKERYNWYFRRTYVESRPTIKWCPAPGCEYAVKYDVGSASYDVVCGCRNAFCWNCTEDAHRPVDCETVSAWVAKNSSEAENTNWILANSKPCPKCKRPIEKNTGCMHMTCTLCRFEFCWLCLGDWKAHGESTGGFYACNAYSKAKASGELDEAEMKRQMASNSLERYTHYYERWESNNLSRQKALKELNDMHNVHLLMLSKSQNQPEAQVQFGVEAWQQIVECRRVLKWSYAYGYYLPAHESTKKNIFEYMQGQADAALDRLHHCAEIELKKYIYPEAPEFEGEYFNAFRSKLANLTIVTRNFFENLVKALENGLCDVDPEKTSSQQETPMIYKAYDESLDYWQCLHCTYVNRAIQTECEMCFIGVPPYNT